MQKKTRKKIVMNQIRAPSLAPAVSLPSFDVVSITGKAILFSRVTRPNIPPSSTAIVDVNITTTLVLSGCSRQEPFQERV